MHAQAGASNPGDADRVRAQGIWRPRFVASGTHLLLSAIVAGVVLLLVYRGWYAAPLDRACGVGEILMLLLAVDVTLGPLLTLVVFDPKKKSLRFDLACIALVQLGALAYGLHTVEAGRPHYLVFVKDRFEIVSKADLRPDDIAAAKGNPRARPGWFSPSWLAVDTAVSGDERNRMMLEAMSQGTGARDHQHFPARYRDLATQRSAVIAKAFDLGALEQRNPGREADIARLVADLGRERGALKALPMKGELASLAVVIDANTGEPLRIVDLNPWP